MSSMEVRMPSDTYLLFAWAAQNRMRLRCLYEGRAREICPIVVGHTGDKEKALVRQVAGETSEGPLLEPKWKCFTLSGVGDPEPCAGEWMTGPRHSARQSCVAEVDYDSNEASPYGPTQSLGDLRVKLDN
jgi:hypothetical protein